jgi:hypothetical protein
MVSVSPSLCAAPARCCCEQQRHTPGSHFTGLAERSWLWPGDVRRTSGAGGARGTAGRGCGWGRSAGAGARAAAGMLTRRGLCVSPQTSSRGWPARRPSSLLRSRTRARPQPDSQAVWRRDGREKDERVIGWSCARAEAAPGVLAPAESDSAVRATARTRPAASRGGESAQAEGCYLAVQRELATTVFPSTRRRPATPRCRADALSSSFPRGIHDGPPVFLNTSTTMEGIRTGQRCRQQQR